MTAPNPTNLASGNIAGGATGITASITPTHNAVDGCCLLWVAIQDTTSAFVTTINTVTGAGLTWTRVTGGTGTAAAHWGLWLFIGTGTPTAGALTITPDATASNYAYVVDQIASGVDISNVAGWQVANANTGTGTATSLAPAVASAGANDMVMGGCVHRVNEAQTAEHTLLGNFTHATPDYCISSQYNPGNGDLSMGWSWTTTQSAAACTVAVPYRAGAVVAKRNITSNTLNQSTYASGSFTPAVGDLLVVGAFISASGSPTSPRPSCTASANGITFTRVEWRQAGGNAHSLVLFVADQLVGASPSAMTVTVDVTGDAGTGVGLFAYAVTGMSKAGTTAVRQSSGVDNISATNAPTVTFAAAALTTNPIVGLVGIEGSNPAGITPPTNFTEDTGADLGWATPVTGAEFCYRNSGHTASTVVWGSNTSIYCAIAVEFDASSAAAPVTKTHTTDAALKALARTKTHTTDAALKALARTKTHTTDAFLQAPTATKTQTVDAYLIRSPGPPLDTTAWWDASDTSSITQVSGAVSQWNDKSGNGNHLTQATAGSKPTSGTRTQSGRNVIDFDGSADVLALASFTLAQPFTYAIVVQKDTNAGNDGIVGSPNASGASAYTNVALWASYAGGAGITGGTVDTSPHYVVWIFNGASSTIYVDGTLVAGPGNSGSNGWSAETFQIGGGGTGGVPADFLDGWVGEALVIPSALGTADRQVVENYLYNRWFVSVVTSTKTHTTSGYLVKRLTKTHTTNALLKATFTRTHTTSGYLVKRLTKAHTTDALLKALAKTRTHTTSGYLVKRLTKTHTADALLRQTRTRAQTVDAFLVRRLTKTHTADTLLRRTSARTQTVDGFLVARKTRSHTTSAVLLRTATKTHSTSAFVVLRKTRTHSTDTLLRATFTRAHTTSGFLVKRLTVTASTDALLRRTATAAHTTSAFLTAPGRKTHLADALLRLTSTKTQTTDAVLIRRVTRGHSTDAAIAAIRASTHTTDTLLRRTSVLTHTTDAVLLSTRTRAHTTDVLTRGGAQLAHTADALLRRTEATTHTADALARATAALTHTTDAYLTPRQTLVHTTDAFLVGQKTHTTDAFLQLIATVTHRIDALLRGPNRLTHSTDALVLQAGNTVTHSTDARLTFVDIRRAHATDALISIRLYQTHTTDADVKAFGLLAQHATDAFLIIVGRTRTHSTDALLKLRIPCPVTVLTVTPATGTTVTAAAATDTTVTVAPTTTTKVTVTPATMTLLDVAQNTATNIELEACP